MFLSIYKKFSSRIRRHAKFDGGLSNALLDHGPVKVFADGNNDAKIYDQNSKLNIHRVSGFKIFRKYRKANLK